MSSRANSIAVDRLPEAHLQLQIMNVDFNQRCLKTPQFVQCIQSSTRGINTLDCVYSNLKHTYKAISICQPSFTAYATLRRSEPGQKGLCHSCRIDSLTHKGFFFVLLSSLFHVDTVCKHICKHSKGLHPTVLHKWPSESPENHLRLSPVTRTSNSCTFLAETEQTLSTLLRDRCNTCRPL